MNSVAIILGDNDFGNTFTNLLKSIKLVLDNDPEMREDAIRSLISEGIRYHYIAFQNRDRYKVDGFDSVVDYLVSGLTVLFDDKADAACLTEDHDSGAWHLHVPTGNITSF